jgi:hypothetical protein
MLESDVKMDFIEVYSISGSLIYGESLNSYSNRLNLNFLNDGMYLLRLRAEDGSWLSEKLVIE